MFEKATKTFVKRVDQWGNLIPASSPNDSRKLRPLSVVLKSKKKWFWQRIKYRPTEFTLNDLLKGKKSQIKPVCKREEFVNYEETDQKRFTGRAEVGGAAVTINLKGHCASKLASSLGTLKKEYVDIPKLLNDSKGRKLDMEHSLIQQSRKKNTDFTLVKERIFTTSNCEILFAEQGNCSCQALFGDFFTQMSCECKAKQLYGSEAKLEIPPNTVVAYSVTEMSIDVDGLFELCLVPGGSEQNKACEVDGKWLQIQEDLPLSKQKKGVFQFLRVLHKPGLKRKYEFCILSFERRSSILVLLRKTLLDRPVLSTLMDTLEDLSSGETQCFFTRELPERQSQIIDDILNLLKCESLENSSSISTANHSNPLLKSNLNGSNSAASHHNGLSKKATKCNLDLICAMWKLISALEELTDAVLKQLEQFCIPDRLSSLQDLISELSSSHTLIHKNHIPEFFQNDEEFQRAEELLKSCGVLIKKENDTLISEMTSREGFLPLILCIAIHGLASLCSA